MTQRQDTGYRNESRTVLEIAQLWMLHKLAMRKVDWQANLMKPMCSTWVGLPRAQTHYGIWWMGFRPQWLYTGRSPRSQSIAAVVGIRYNH